MAVELGPHGIRVNSINPTVVMTEMGKRAWSDPSKDGPMLARIPLQRFAECGYCFGGLLCPQRCGRDAERPRPSGRRRFLGDLEQTPKEIAAKWWQRRAVYGRARR
jgi:NAD(P)-dependent dehydrogenase (short-subunit alcohol dehydrogenase family)